MRKIVKNTSSAQRASQLINPILDKGRFPRGWDPSARVGRSAWYNDGEYSPTPLAVVYRQHIFEPEEDELADYRELGGYGEVGFRIVRNK